MRNVLLCIEIRLSRSADVQELPLIQLGDPGFEDPDLDCRSNLSIFLTQTRNVGRTTLHMLYLNQPSLSAANCGCRVSQTVCILEFLPTAQDCSDQNHPRPINLSTVTRLLVVSPVFPSKFTAIINRRFSIGSLFVKADSNRWQSTRSTGRQWCCRCRPSRSSAPRGRSRRS